MIRFSSFLLLFLLVASFGASAQNGFSAVISPPRIELDVKPGQSYRQVIEVMNDSASPSVFHVRSADWTLDQKKDWAVDFFEGPGGATSAGTPLQPDSCRPWLTLESNEIRLQGGAKKRYRFEVKVPADALSRECRVAIMVEGQEPSRIKGMPVQVSGRIAVIVYLRVGDAHPDLSIVGVGTTISEGQRFPYVKVTNQGNATARLAGLLRGKDASGKVFFFVPSSSPVLPGMARSLLLVPQADTPNSPPPTLHFPVQIEDRLEWGAFQTPFKATFEEN